ncbi:hypothetical protein N7510_007762 [Penicillium lagena]|uniref:uncharacterized protein n=1 Tax=Penicillium lagena TaxID=94218 RepID=UPI0025423134|nr:uncharacterized protein N7510_007762 [Penicillium lagena]KAJ5611043.1 hypothetical protein N7510_007762 [Penicillium lagena]
MVTNESFKASQMNSASDVTYTDQPVYQFTIYTSTASQWAYVPQLALVQEGYNPSEYDSQHIDLVGGENFNPDYLKINPNGTIPSLTSPALQRPLIESVDILEYLDSFRREKFPLFPTNAEQRSRVNDLIAHVHQEKLSTNLILLKARDLSELNAKRASLWNDFLVNRQKKLIKYGAAHPEIPLYQIRIQENGKLYDIYKNQKGGTALDQFFSDSEHDYQVFATGLDKLDTMLILPYAVGDNVTAADLHVVPWLAHALWGAGGSQVYDFNPLEKLIQKSVPQFCFGEKTKAWWQNISKTNAFRKNYPALH